MMSEWMNERKMTMELLEGYAPCALIRFSLPWRQRLEWASDEACRLLGYSRAALLADGGMPLEQLVPKEELRRLLSEIRIHDEGSCNYRGPCLFLNQEGEELPLLFCGGLLPRDDGSDSILALLWPLESEK